MWNRRELVQVALGAFGAVTSTGGRVQAQEVWPSRMITVVVPFPPGGTSDLAARPLAAFLQERFGQNVIESICGHFRWSGPHSSTRFGRKWK